MNIEFFNERDGIPGQQHNRPKSRTQVQKPAKLVMRNVGFMNILTGVKVGKWRNVT